MKDSVVPKQESTDKGCRPIRGFLFDLYHFEDVVHLWILDDAGRPRMFTDHHYPVLYARGPARLLDRLVDRLYERGALLGEPRFVTRRLFYENWVVEAMELSISTPTILPEIRRNLFAFYRRMDLYHSDIELPTAYMNAKGIHPLGPVEIETEGDSQWISSIRSTEPVTRLDYEVPDFRILRLETELSHRIPLESGNRLRIRYGTKEHLWRLSDARSLLRDLNLLLEETDPDIVLSNFGDKAIFPRLFDLSRRSRVPFHIDRDREPITKRRIVTKGSSFNTYGSWIYMAPSYPLFGRWHIDAANSFVYKESNLAGVIELSRISRIPVQRLARSSTGGALTAIETAQALSMGYLIPWQKSALEEPRSAYHLLQVDKGGLVFMPRIDEGCVYEGMAQIDFSQMYPTIMDIHNISPETIQCGCCREDPEAPRVPEAGYHICTKRRGVVAESLREVLRRRAYYKRRLRERDLPESERLSLKSRQESLKWMLVTSFGYLGYRNAKFGRLESHESVTAFGRDKLLTAKEIAEETGYRVVHAITDCLFLSVKEEGKALMNEAAITDLCNRIAEKTGVEMGSDGIYSWIVFLPSRNDGLLPTANRYMGRFLDGSLKYRGIAARRKDTPAFIARCQMRMLSLMATAFSVAELRGLHGKMDDLYRECAGILRRGDVEWRDFLIRKTVSRQRGEYAVETATSLSLEELAEGGVSVEPGEKLRYLKLAGADKRESVVTEEKASKLYDRITPPLDETHYLRLLFEAYREIWEHFSPEHYFAELKDAQYRLF